MQTERDELVKQVFPRLRKLCEERGVFWSEVDLRWGITEEQSQRGEVLPVCLAEIRRSKPYFLALLGERYGWIPDNFPSELIDQEPWLRALTEHSVTELEIVEGVLRDPEMAKNAFFYFRDPSFIKKLPREKRNGFLELPTDEEIAAFGLEEAERRARERQQKLAALKERIRVSGLPLRENYADAQALGEMVLADLTKMIDRLYPKGSEPNPLQREAMAHEWYAESRAGVYIGRKDYFDRLDAHVEQDGPPLLLTGESGAGKSALLSNWALQRRDNDEFLVMHFIGATSQSADWVAMVRRIMGEMARRFQIEQEIPDAVDALKGAFANFLSLAGAKGKVVLLIDGLNQLEDRDAAPDLAWLPLNPPGNIRMILSTLPGRPLDEAQRRGWPTFFVEPLNEDERIQLIRDYLAQFSKRLSDAQERRIASASQSSNPLFLRALLDELRVFGVHEQVDARIDHYLKAADPGELYSMILDRYEQDYERDRPGLVKDSMALLWAARNGLSESELMDLLGSKKPLPRAYWSPLFLAAEQSLINRSGMLSFSHAYLREAARAKYVPSEKEARAAHRKLANYFSKMDIGIRKISELPWQFAKAESWKRLAELLSDPPFLVAAWEAAMYDVLTYWNQIERNSNIRMIDHYGEVPGTAGQTDFNHDYAWCCGVLLASRGHRDAALRLRTLLVEHFKKTGERTKLATAISNRALLLMESGRLDEAMAAFVEAEKIDREIGNKDGLQIVLGNQAVILEARGEFAEASRLLTQKEILCRELGNRQSLANALGNHASLLSKTGARQEAMKLYRQQEEIHREIGDRYGLAVCLGNQAVLLHQEGRSEEALKYIEFEEEVCREFGVEDGIAKALGKRGAILYARGEFGTAMDLHKQEMKIFQKTGNKMGQWLSMRNQIPVAMSLGDFIYAQMLGDRVQELGQELGLYEQGFGPPPPPPQTAPPAQPPKPKALTADDLFEAGRWEDALGRYQRAINEDKGTPEIILRMGLCLLRKTAQVDQDCIKRVKGLIAGLRSQGEDARADELQRELNSKTGNPKKRSWWPFR